MDIIDIMIAENVAQDLADELSTRIDELINGLTYLGAVDYYDDLPTTGNTTGDCYSVLYQGSSGTEEDGSRYVWGPVDGVGTWIKISNKYAVDNEPKENSDNLVLSGGVYSADAKLQENVEAALGTFPQKSVGPADVVTFSDGADGVPIKSGTFQVVPAQDLNGQDHPWPEQHLYDASTNTAGYYYDDNLDWVENSSVVITDYMACSFPTVDIELASSVGVVNLRVNCFDDQKVIKSQVVVTTSAGTLAYKASLPSGTAFIRISTNPTSAPFDDIYTGNICPITGWTGANINRWASDLFTGAASWVQNTYINVNGTTTSNSYYKYDTRLLPCTPGESILGRAYRTEGRNTTFALAFYDSAQNFIERQGQAAVSNAGYIWCVATAPSNAAYVQVAAIDKRATSVHVFSGGVLYPISWQTEAGTVYGGTLEYKGGGAWKLTKTMTRIDLGTLAWTRDGSGAFYASVSGIKNGIRPMLCEALDYYSGNFQLSQYASYADNIIGGNVNGGAFVYAKCTTYSTAATFTTAMNGKYLVYTLATPTTYDLTGADVLTLLGENAIFTDCGQTKVKYRVDPSMNIEALIDAKVPDCDTSADGTFVLKAVVTDGEVTYAWVAEE